MADEHNFLGIDLGTTNSVVSWGRFVRRMSIFQPEVIPVEFLDKGMKAERKELLPSVVYFEEGKAPIVGEYARSDAFSTQPQLVVKSIKSKMGSGEKVLVGKREFTPAYISSFILNQIRAATKDKFGAEEDDVIITVPASFDADMRADTIEAARAAGFKTKNADGTPRDILLDEPRAALHYLVYQQQIDEISTNLINFSTPKTVLIFDLGGGTLDVSLHRVTADYDRLDVDVEDLAISRYTRIGGDNFDESIARFFQADFEAKYNLKIAEIPEAYKRHPIESQLLLEAESKKREINDLFSQGIKQKATLDMLRPKVTVKVFIPQLYDDKPYSRRFTWDEMEQVIAPLMGKGLTLASVDEFEKLDKEAANNIIYPILDVLHKAKIRNKGELPPIDAVFLNGGMTRFIPVRQRIDEFFGKSAITLLDPDKSVALGAALYHYALHQGIKPKTVILAETIGIEVNGNIVKPLIPAGTVLPTPHPHRIEGLTIPAGTSELTIPFFRGESHEPTFPNVQVQERVIRLPYVCRKAEPILAEVTVDFNKILTFRAHLKSDPAVVIEVEVQSSGEPIKRNEETLSPRVQTLPPAPPKLPKPSGEAMEVDSSLKKLFLSDHNSELSLKNGIEKDILNAKNGADFILPIATTLDGSPPSEFMKHAINICRAIIILGSLAKTYPDHLDNGPALRVLMKLCESRKSVRNPEIKYRRFIPLAISAMGKMQNPACEDVLIGVLKDKSSDSMWDFALVALAKVSNSASAIEATAQCIENSKVQIRMRAGWALGKMGSRDRTSPAPVRLILPVIERLWDQLLKEQEGIVARMLVYGLGELCDQRGKDPRIIVSPEVAKDITSQLGDYERKVSNSLARKDSNLKGTIHMAVDMMSGKPLAIEQERVLLSLRSKLDDDGTGE